MAGGPAPLPAAQAVQSWTSGAKDLVMTALGTSRVWATTGQGIFTEIYWPAVGPAPGQGPRVPRRRRRLVAGGQAGRQLHAVHSGARPDAADHRARREQPGLPADPAAGGGPGSRRTAHRLRTHGRGRAALPVAGPAPGCQPDHPGVAVGGARGRQPGLDRPGGPGPVRQRKRRLPVPARPARLHPRRSRLRGRHRRLDRLQPQPVDDADLQPGRARRRRPDRGAGRGLRAARPGLRRQPGRGPRRGPGEPWTLATTQRRRRSPGAGRPGRRTSPCPAPPSWPPRRPGWPTRCGSRRWCCGLTPTTS